MPAHRAVLERLVAAVATDPRVWFVELDCSVARGAGDAFSDLDLALGIADDAWPDVLAAVPGILEGLGDLVDLFDHEVEGWAGIPHRRFFAQYRDGVQVDLVALPASRRSGLPPGSVALHDPHGRLATPFLPRSEQATADDVREWAYLGWTALVDLDKYLRRGSAWEALERLNGARANAWRLWAVATGVPYPVFGLTSVLDGPSPTLPEGIETTVGTLQLADLRRAALALAAVLESVSPPAAERTGAALPLSMAEYVLGRLREADPT